MDNYSLKEVKMLIDNNMVTPEIFNNIIKSTTRRIELYNDKDDWEILKYLSKCSLVPIEAQKEINKYLDSYDKYRANYNKKRKETSYQRKKSVLVILIIVILLIFLCIFLEIKMRLL